MGEKAIHGDGESGKLITTVPARVGYDQVHPIGTLVAIQEIKRKDSGVEDEYSIAIPIDHTLHRLSTTEYCGGRPVKLITHYDNQATS